MKCFSLIGQTLSKCTVGFDETLVCLNSKFNQRIFGIDEKNWRKKGRKQWKNEENRRGRLPGRGRIQRGSDFSAGETDRRNFANPNKTVSATRVRGSPRNARNVSGEPGPNLPGRSPPPPRRHDRRPREPVPRDEHFYRASAGISVFSLFGTVQNRPCTLHSI